MTAPADPYAAISAQAATAITTLQQLDPLVQAAEAGFAASQQQVEQLLATNASLVQQVKDLNDELAQAQEDQPVGYTEVRPGGDLQGLVDKNTPVLVRGPWPQAKNDLLLPPTGATKIWLGDDADLKVNITNRDKTGPTGDVTIRGTGRISSDDGGDLFKLRAASLVLMDFTTPIWHDGRWAFPGTEGALEVTRVTFDCDPSASSGTGGLRISHCGSAYVHDIIDCSAGDDLWQCVPAGNTGDTLLFNRGDCRNVVFARLHGGRSYAGRLCVEGLQDQFDDGKLHGMKSGVYGVLWDTIDGYSGKSAFVHQNKSSTGKITGTRTKDVTISRKYAVDGQKGEIFLNGVAGTGGIDDVDLSGVTIVDDRLNDKNHVIFAQQGLVTNVVRPPQAA